MSTEMLMISLIRKAICGIQDETLPSPLFSSVDELNALYNLSKVHDVAHIVASVLTETEYLENSDEIRKKFKKQLMLAVYRYEQINYELNQICNVFEDANLRHMPLKGSVIRKYYPESWMRTSCDIDILIDDTDSQKAIDILVNKLNYIRKEDLTTHDYQLVSPSGVHLELHYTLIDEDSLSSAADLLEKVWDQSFPADGCTYMHNMAYEMFLLYHMAHMAKHFLHGGCGIRFFLDLWLIEKHNSKASRQLTNQMLSDASLLDFYRESLNLARVWFEKAPHTAFSEQLEKYILSGGIYGTAQNAATISAGKGESKSSSFFKIAFLPKKNLEVLYPNLKKWPILFPVYQVMRWFRVFKKEKFDKVANITNIRSSVTDESKDTAKNLLSGLGLDK